MLLVLVAILYIVKLFNIIFAVDRALRPSSTAPMMKSVTLLVFASAAGGFASNFEGIQPRQANWTVGQTVQTSSGPVAGHAATNDSTVSEYLGIPFGKAPIGDLRFAAPVKFTGTAPLNGSSFVSFLLLDPVPHDG